MGIKDVNVFEQHVEKIVLGVAVAGALFMGWLATQKVTIQGTELGPNDIEPAIAAEITKMENTLEDNRRLGPPVVTIQDYERDYTRLSGGEPLRRELRETQVVVGPKNLAPGQAPGPGVDGGQKTVTPNPVGILATTFKVDVFQEPVALKPPPILELIATGQPIPPAGIPSVDPGIAMGMGGVAINLPTRDQNAAYIEGYIPLGQMVLEMLQVKDDNLRITDPQRHRAVIARIHVQRRQANGNGWTAWADVAPTKSYPQAAPINWDADVTSIMTTLEEQFKQVVLPDFYLNAQGQVIQPRILTRVIPADIITQMEKLDKDLTSARAAVPGAMLPAGAGLAGLNLVNPIPGMPGPGMMPGGVAPGAVPGAPVVPAGPTFPQDATVIRGLPIVPFTFWDETVKTDHTYQYQVKVEIVNPTYGWVRGLAKPEMKDEKTLSTEWATTREITIHSDLVFYVYGSTDMGPTKELGVNTKIYKMTGGKWYLNGNVDVAPGANVAGKIRIVDEQNKFIDVDTNYTVVDVQRRGGVVQVVFKDPAGNLVTRDSASDRERERADDLVARIQKVTAPPPPLGPDGLPLPPGAIPPGPGVPPGPTRGMPPVGPTPRGTPRGPTQVPVRGAPAR